MTSLATYGDELVLQITGACLYRTIMVLENPKTDVHSHEMAPGEGEIPIM